MNGKYLAGVFLLVVGLATGCGEDGSVDVDSTTSNARSSTTVEPPTVTTANEQPSTRPPTVEPESPNPEPPPPAPAPEPEPEPAPIPEPCPETLGWNTLDDTSNNQNYVREDLYDVRYQTGECADEVIFYVDTSENVTFSGRYTDSGDGQQVGSGLPVVVEGDAALQIAIHAPVAVYDLFAGSGFNPNPNWPALREVIFTGSFEGVTTFVIGVDHKTPFAVEYERQGGKTQVVVRIAH